MIALTCPTCGERLQALDEHAGAATQCGECGETVRVPGPRFRRDLPRRAPTPPAAAAPRPDRGRFWAGVGVGVAGALVGLSAGVILLLALGGRGGDQPLWALPLGTWTVNFRPGWVGQWPGAENGREADELEQIIEQRLQDRTFTSLALRPNVLVLGPGVWERSPAREREAFFPLLADYFDLKGCGDRYEIRAPAPSGLPGPLLATFSRAEGLRPISGN